MPKIIVAHYFQETNSFHPNPTTYENFGVTRGEDLIRDVMSWCCKRRG